jgi:hypothetical protein
MKVARATRRADKMEVARSDLSHRGMPMRTLTLLLMLTAGATQALAAGKARGSRRTPAPRSAPAATAEARPPEARAAEPAPEASQAPEPRPEGKASSGKAPRAKVYTFSGLDVEGKLKTPQLLYFLNRVRLELDTTGRERRSFLKELEESSDDKGL